MLLGGNHDRVDQCLQSNPSFLVSHAFRYPSHRSLINYRFQYTREMSGHCFNDSKYYFGNGIANMLIDICVLAYPVPIVWKVCSSAKLNKQS
jgi:hypothetical protein